MFSIFCAESMLHFLCFFVCENTMLPLGSKTNYSWEALVSLGSTNNLISAVRSACLWSDQQASLYEKHDETTWYCNTNRSCKNKSGKMGIEFLWNIKRTDITPWIPWKYEVNTLKCILPLSWCIQMGSDNIESRTTTTTTPKPIMERFLHRLFSKLKFIPTNEAQFLAKV